MITKRAARNIVGVIGNVMSFFLFASPAPTFYKIIKKKSVEEFKADPYLATVMSSMLWVFYGLPIVHPDSLLVVTINATGLAMELIYCTLYFIYADKKGRVKLIRWILIEVVAIAILATCTLLFVHTHVKRSAVVGLLCVIFATFMYAAPLTVMGKVIKTKSVKYMPFSLSLASFLNGLIWVSYALIEFDLYLLIGNGLGALCGAAQLILYSCYYKSTTKDDYRDTKRPGVQLISRNT